MGEEIIPIPIRQLIWTRQVDRPQLLSGLMPGGLQTHPPPAAAGWPPVRRTPRHQLGPGSAGENSSRARPHRPRPRTALPLRPRFSAPQAHGDL